MLPPLIRHGHLDGVLNKSANVAQNAKNQKDQKSVTCYRKRHRASESVQAFNLIKATYENAIEYRTIPAQVRGLALLFGCISACFALWFGWTMFSSILSHGVIAKAYYFLLAVIGVMVIGGLLLFVLTLRTELFRPIDEPIIFDRKNRKVYLITRAVAPGWSGLFKPWPVRAYEYDWNLTDAEYQLTITTTGTTVTTWHTLLFSVRQSASDKRTIGSFNVANPVLLSESTVAPFWEHIRRFMEEAGPHLPPGETKTY